MGNKSRQPKVNYEEQDENSSPEKEFNGLDKKEQENGKSDRFG